MQPTVTMEQIYLAVRDARRSGDRYFDAVAQACGADPDSEGFTQMVKSMVVSGFLRDREGSLSIGPTPLPSAGGVAVPARRPRPGTTAAGKDRLKIAPRMRLWDDEIPTGSDYVRTEDGLFACAAGITKNGIATVRLGIGILEVDKRNWSGSDGGSTVVLTGEHLGALDRAVENVIAAAEAAKEIYRAADRRLDKARDNYMFWESKRIGEDGAVKRRQYEDVIERESKMVTSEYQLGGAQEFVDQLDPPARAEYDRIFAQIHQHLGVDTRAIDKLAAAQGARREILAQLAVLMPGIDLTLDEARELMTLHDDSRYNPREEELRHKSGGFVSGRWSWLERILNWHRGTTNSDDARYNLNWLEYGAKEVDAQTQEQIRKAHQETVEADAAYEAIAGMPIETVEIPAQWGTVMVMAAQGEEGEPHHFEMGVRPDGARPGWSPSDNGDPFRPKAAEMRKVARMVRTLYEGAIPAGYQAQPAAVIPGV